MRRTLIASVLFLFSIALSPVVAQTPEATPAETTPTIAGCPVCLFLI